MKLRATGRRLRSIHGIVGLLKRRDRFPALFLPQALGLTAAAGMV
jgi:hypothetical protein